MSGLWQIIVRTAGGVRRSGLRKRCGTLLCAAVLALALAAGASAPAWALSAGTYLVTMHPSYTDPETGRIEDPGNNEAIGQGMTEKLCGPTGLLEVDADGSMYLTVRYYLSQFVSDVSFEERSGGSYSTLSYEKMQTKAPVDGSSNIDEKYGFTDYRMPVSGTDSVFRGKAYVEPMGRNVVYFFTFSNPVAGSGDFVTDSIAEEPEAEEEIIEEEIAEEAAPEEIPAAELRGEDDAEEAGDAEAFAEFSGRPEETEEVSADFNGRGSAEDPVTGIPKKPSSSAAGKAGSGSVKAASADGYHLDTVYDLSDVPSDEARRLTEPMLEKAVGITGLTGDAEAAETSAKEISGSELLMRILLGAAGILLVWFAAAQLSQAKKRSGAEDTRERDS